MCGCPTGAFDPDVIAVSGTSTSANRCDEPDRHAPGAPGRGRRRDRRATDVRKPIEPGRDEQPRIRRRTDESERASIEPARSGPRRRDPQPIQASGMTMSAQPSASRSRHRGVERLLPGRGVLQPERRVVDVRCRDARQRLEDRWIDLDPAVDPRSPARSRTDRRPDRRVTPASVTDVPDSPGVGARRQRNGPGSRDGHRPPVVGRIDDPQARLGGDDRLVPAVIVDVEHERLARPWARGGHLRAERSRGPRRRPHRSAG